MVSYIARECPLESEEQKALFQWAKLCSGQYPELRGLVASANGGARSAITGARLKAEGVRKGFPDIQLMVPRGRYHGLAIEMKRQKGGSVSAEQRWWLNWLNDNGYKAVVCHGAGEAIHVISDYLLVR